MMFAAVESNETDMLASSRHCQNPQRRSRAPAAGCETVRSRNPRSHLIQFSDLAALLNRHIAKGERRDAIGPSEQLVLTPAHLFEIGDLLGRRGFLQFKCEHVAVQRA